MYLHLAENTVGHEIELTSNTNKSKGTIIFTPAPVQGLPECRRLPTAHPLGP